MRRYVWVALVAGALLAAGCGDSPSSTLGGAGATTTVQEDTAAPTTAVTSTTPGLSHSIEIVSDNLGDHLADDAGYSVYLFVPDDGGPSTCEGSCAASWPPVVGEFGAGDGVDASLLGTSQRSDGGEQVTYNGWPLYYYGGDSAPGDTTGQAVSGVWYVVGPSGEAIKAATDPREDYYGEY